MNHTPKNKGKGLGLQFVRDHVSHQGDDCVIWPFCRNKINGYGYLGADGRRYSAHRFMCECAHGKAPSAKHHAAHSCHQRLCINPRHLSWKTLSENMLDKRDNGTANRAWWGRKGKLTQEQAAEIRALQGTMTQDAIAKKFNVTEATVRNVQKGKTHTGKVLDWGAINQRTADARRKRNELALAVAQKAIAS